MNFVGKVLKVMDIGLFEKTPALQLKSSEEKPVGPCALLPLTDTGEIFYFFIKYCTSTLNYSMT